MKRILSMLKIFFFLLLATWILPANADQNAQTITVMVYMCGSNLESWSGSAYKDLQEMMLANYDASRVNVIVMAGGTKQWIDPCTLDADTTHILTLGKSKWGKGDIKIKEDVPLPQMNMSDGKTLRYFLNYGVEHAPADRYALIFWNHGCGPAQGLCLDENYPNDSLTLNELEQALAGSPFVKDPLEWIGFDACLMCTVEMASKMAPYSHYMIASEETEPARGWNYRFLKGLEIDLDGAATGRRIVDMYFDSLSRSHDNLTMSCLDLSRIGILESAMNGFYQSLSEKLDAKSWSKISALRVQAVGFGKTLPESGYDMVDVYSLSSCYEELNPEGSVSIENAINEVVVYTRSSVNGSHGIAAYHPYRNKKDYLESWRDGYNALDFCEGYSAYVEKYGEMITGEQLLRWKQLGTPQYADAGSGSVLCTLPLSEEERNNIASARLIVVARNVYDAADDSYTRIFSTSDVTVDDAGLSAVYDGTCIEICHNACIEYATGAITYQTTENGTYLIRMEGIDEKGSGQNREIYGEYIREDGTNRLLLMHYMVYDELTGQLTERNEVNLSDYDHIEFKREYRLQTDNDHGEHLSFNNWREDEHSTDGYKITETEFTPVIGKHSFGDHLLVMFEITDLQGNFYTSGMTTIDGGLYYASGKVSEMFSARDENNPPKYEINATRLMERRTDDEINGYMLFQVIVTNTDNRDLLFELKDVELNSEKFSQLHALNSDGKGAKYKDGYALAPGETRAVTVKIDQSMLTQLFPDTELTSISAWLWIKGIDQNDNWHDLECKELQVETEVLLTDYASETSVLPPEEHVRLAESGSYDCINTNAEQRIFENEACRVSLAGFYVCDGSAVMLIHAENMTDEVLNLSLFRAKINGEGAAIGEKKNAYFTSHNGQVSAFCLSGETWMAPQYASVSMKGHESRLEYVSVTPERADVTEMYDFSFSLFVDCKDLDNNVMSDEIVISFSSEPAPLQKGFCSFATNDMLTVTEAGVSSEAGDSVQFFVSDTLPRQTKVYSLSFDSPRGKVITLGYYCILRKIGSDRELAEQLVNENEFFNTGNTWLMKTAVGWLNLSEDGTAATADYVGILPILRYQGTSIPLTAMLQSREGDSLKLEQNGNQLQYGPVEFTAVLKAENHIKMDIDLKTGTAEVAAATVNILPVNGLLLTQEIGLVSADASKDELVNMLEKPNSHYVTIPSSGKTVDIGLVPLDDPENYVVVFRYKTEDGKMYTSDPVQLNSFRSYP